MSNHSGNRAPMVGAHPRRAMRATLPVGRMVLDAVAVGVLVAGAGLAFGPAYGGTRFLVALGLGALVGVLAGLVPALLRWSAWITLPIALLGYLALGAAAAVPRTTIGGMLPSGESVRLLTVGVITSWKQMLTVAVPLGSSGTLLVPAFLSAALLTTVAVLLALRTTRPITALLPAAVMAGGAALLGADQAFHPAISGTAWGLAALVWAGAHRRATGRPGLDLRRPVALLAMLIPAVAAGVLLGPQWVADTPRVISREVVQPPFDPTTLPSPLAGYRHYVKTVRDQTQISITGAPDGARIRLATLDDYNGRFFSTSADTGVFQRVGDRLAQVPEGTPATIDVTVGRYSDVWVPDLGYLASVEFGGPDAERLRTDFRYNRDTGAALVTSGLRPGDRYTMTVSVPAQPSVEQLAGVPAEAVEQPPLATVVPEVAAKAQEWSAGAEDPVGVVSALATALQDNGWISHGGDVDGVPGGHGTDRIRRLLTARTMYGDAEQYATAMALMVRSKGIPARVVMGFAPGADGGPADRTGAGMTAWVEVPFEGYGWVAFDPLPSEAKPPPTQKPDENQSRAEQQRVQPPPPPIPPKDAEAEAQDQPDTPDSPDTPQDQPPPPPPATDQPFPWDWVALGGGLLLLLLIPVGVVLLLKSRRRRRLAAGRPDQRIAGAWIHLLGGAADLGTRTPVGVTRTEAAATLDDTFSRPTDGSGIDTRGGVAVLARTADSRVFAPEPIEPAEATRYWEQIEAELAAMRRSRSGWRRLRARLSVTSLKERR